MSWKDSIKAKLIQAGHRTLERRFGHIQLTFTTNAWYAQRECTRHSAMLAMAGACSTLQGLSGWPKLRFQVWSVDSDGRTDICGYGALNCPTTPGMYEMRCPLWVPEGTSSTLSTGNVHTFPHIWPELCCCDLQWNGYQHSSLVVIPGWWMRRWSSQGMTDSG